MCIFILQPTVGWPLSAIMWIPFENICLYNKKRKNSEVSFRALLANGSTTVNAWQNTISREAYKTLELIQCHTLRKIKCILSSKLTHLSYT